MVTEVRQILGELKAIRAELGYIKDNLPAKEIFLSLEERKLLEESYRNEKEGKTVSSKSLRKLLGI